MPGFRNALGIGAIALSGLGLSRVAAQDDAGADPARPEYYSSHVRPIFDQNCKRCHEGTAHKGGLNLDTRAALLKGGHHGPAVVPGDPAASWLLRLIRHEGPADDPMPMPPQDNKLSDADIATVTRWIQAGAVMPEPAPPQQP